MMDPRRKSECIGRQTVTTKIDGETRRFLVEEAESLGVSNAEFLRRLIAAYRESQRGELRCPNCGGAIRLSAEEAA